MHTSLLEAHKNTIITKKTQNTTRNIMIYLEIDLVAEGIRSTGLGEMKEPLLVSTPDGGGD